MRKFKLDKQMSKRIAAFSMVGIVFISSMNLSGCSKKETNKENTNTTISTVDEPVVSYEKEKTLVNSTKDRITNMFPEMDENIVNNSTLILLLDVLAKEDENGKVNAEIISNFKSKIDTDNMMNEFNAFLDQLEQMMISENKTVSISNVLPEELEQDKIILSNIETITSNIINGKDKNEIVTNFNKIYELFVEENEIEINEFKFEIRDLSYSNRAVAEAYARTAAYFARNYITEEQYEKIDKRTNNQNNKAYIKTRLEILNNQMEEKSETDIINLFNNKYSDLEELLNGKINISSDTQKNLINYLNLKYLDSDKVATKDKNEILVEYEETKVNDILLAIDAITTYNNSSQNDIVVLSQLLVDNYKNTNNGKIDEIAINFVQYNSIMLLNTVNSEATFSEIYNNPYFENLYKYFTKQDFTHKYNDINGEVVETNIIWQEISDGANFINNEVILYTLNKLPKVNGMESFTTKAQTNLSESIQYIQNTVSGECEKVDSNEFVKTK